MGAISEPSFRGKIMEMVKLLGQFLALIAMMVSVINAQCVVSCALQSIAGSPASHASPVDPDRTRHACCRHQGVPKPKHQKGEVPCPHPIPPSDEARLNNAGTSFNTIPAEVVIGFSNEYRPQLAETYLDLRTAPDASGVSHLLSIFILRI